MITLKGKPNKIDLDHDYIVLYDNGFHGTELIIQTEVTGDRAQITVDFYNEKREARALKPFYLWRKITEEDREELECIMEV